MKHAAPSPVPAALRRTSRPLATAGSLLGLSGLLLAATPVYGAGNGGNHDCSAESATTMKFESGDLLSPLTMTSGTFTVTVSDVQGKRSDVRSFHFEASPGLVEVIVKGGSGEPRILGGA